MHNELFDFSSLRRQDGSNPPSDLAENEAILKAFEDLRQKLKTQTRENNTLKDELKISTIKCRQGEEALNATLTSSIELKEKCASLQSQNQQFKKKIAMMKETVQGQASYFQEAQFTKQALVELKTHSDMLAQEREKLLELSLAEKLRFEEEIARLQSKAASDSQYLQEVECVYGKCREKVLRLENQLKKLSISYQEEVFSKNWSEGNFETQHLLATIKDLEKDVATLKAKNKKEKQKRVILQDRVIELEELSGFHSVKAETFEGEIEMVTQKYQKLERKYRESKQRVERIGAEKLEVEENLAKTIVVFDELSKKLRELNITQVNSLLQENQSKLNFLSKMNQEINEELYCIQKSTTKLMERTASTLPTSPKPNSHLSSESSYPRPLQSRTIQAENRPNQNLQSRGVEKGKPSLYGSNMTFGDREEDSENAAIENRIRKQREEMERRIKQKILSRKLQTSSPGEQFRLRGDYIKTFIDRRY